MSIPMFFSKDDFYGRLLPGYAAIILTIYYFNFTPNLSGISPSILFIVAGPVIGYILCSVTSYFGSIITSIEQDDTYHDFRKEYAKIRFKATEMQIRELDNTLSTYQFCISTGSIFVFLSTIKIFENLKNVEFFTIFIFIIGIILLFISMDEYEDFRYIYHELESEFIEDANTLPDDSDLT